MSKKSKHSFFNTKAFKTAVFFLAVIVFCVVYYYVSAFFFTQKDPSVDLFPLTIDAKYQENLQIHFIDVGQGDSVYIKTPDNQNILIDAGLNETDKFEVRDYLNSQGVKTINYAIATHPNADHIGGFIDIFENFDVEFMFRPFVRSDNNLTDRLNNTFNPQAKVKSYTDTYATFLNGLRKEKSNWVFFTKDTDIKINYDNGKSLTIDFLTPTQELSQLNYDDLNDFSPLIRVTYGAFSVLFTGDATKSIENEAIENYMGYELRSDILKVAHHGSDTSTSEEFLDAVKPMYAIISCGAGNSYKHPKQSILNLLLYNDVKVRRTDLQGDILVNVDKEGEYVITTQIDYQEQLYKGY